MRQFLCFVFLITGVNCYNRWLWPLMSNLLCNTLWFVALKTVRIMASFIAIIVTNNCVNNAETNIRKVQTYKFMKLVLTPTTDISYLWRNTISTQHETHIFCKECQIPLCSKCYTRKEHCGHNFDDLLEIYAEKYTLQQREFAKIQRYLLPMTQRLKTDIKWDITEVKNIMESIRTSIRLKLNL